MVRVDPSELVPESRLLVLLRGLLFLFSFTVVGGERGELRRDARRTFALGRLGAGRLCVDIIAVASTASSEVPGRGRRAGSSPSALFCGTQTPGRFVRQLKMDFFWGGGASSSVSAALMAVVVRSGSGCLAGLSGRLRGCPTRLWERCARLFRLPTHYWCCGGGASGCRSCPGVDTGAPATASRSGAGGVGRRGTSNAF